MRLSPLDPYPANEILLFAWIKVFYLQTFHFANKSINAKLIYKKKENLTDEV